MKEYLTSKLKEVARKTERLHSNLVDYARELKIKEIESVTKQLQDLKNKQKELTTDCVIWLSIEDFVELYKLDFLDKYGAEYAFKYDHKGITTAQRKYLTENCNYNFRDAKIKD